MAKLQKFIGFPEGMLGGKPFRLPLLVNEPGWFALEKPSGLLAQAHPWHEGKGDITSAIRLQITKGKGELERLGIAGCHYVCGPEFEIFGPVLFAKNQGAGAVLRNALGSDQFVFKFYFLSVSNSVGTELICDLPVALHKEKALALVSHRSGKKASTTFRRIHSHGTVSFWEAQTNFPRLDQVRLHAAEVGISVLGDRLYGGSSGFDIGQSDRNLKRLPRFSGLAMYLGIINMMAVPSLRAVMEVSPPRQFSAFCRKCGIEPTE